MEKPEHLSKADFEFFKLVCARYDVDVNAETYDEAVVKVLVSLEIAMEMRS